MSVQRSLSSSTSFQAQYIGSYTVHADNLTLQNLFPNDGLNPASGLHVRPIPQMSGFTSVTWDGWEKYNALTLTFTQRIWHGLTVDSNYTWSKALDDASNPGTNNAGTNLPQDIQNMAAEKGLSDFDHRHRFVTSFLYQLPFPGGFGRLDPRGVCRLAGRRHLDDRERIAVYRQSLDGRRQQRSASVRAVATAESALRPEQRPEDNGAMVQHVLLCDAGAVHLWQRRPGHRHRAGH